MVQHFKVADWRSTINTPSGERKGLEVNFNGSPVPDDITIQVYELHPNNEFELVMFRINFGISIYNNTIVVFGDKPFDGKIVVK